MEAQQNLEAQVIGLKSEIYDLSKELQMYRNLVNQVSALVGMEQGSNVDDFIERIEYLVGLDEENPAE